MNWRQNSILDPIIMGKPRHRNPTRASTWPIPNKKWGLCCLNRRRTASQSLSSNHFAHHRRSGAARKTILPYLLFILRRLLVGWRLKGFEYRSRSILDLESCFSVLFLPRLTEPSFEWPVISAQRGRR